MAVSVAVRGDVVVDGASLTETLSAAGADADDAAVVVVDAESAADVVLAVGDDALHSLADEPSPTRVLPVATTTGRHGLSAADVDVFLTAVAAGRADLTARTVPHPALSVVTGGVETTAILDAALVTSEAAHISEYAVANDIGDLGSFRADGVVVSTPLGSAGYSHAAGGPVLAANRGLSVVPISPYATRSKTWVVEPPVSVAVVRDESPVSLVVDGERRQEVHVDDPVHVTVDRTIDVVRPTGVGAHRLEKL